MHGLTRLGADKRQCLPLLTLVRGLNRGSSSPVCPGVLCSKCGQTWFGSPPTETANRNIRRLRRAARRAESSPRALSANGSGNMTIV